MQYIITEEEYKKYIENIHAAKILKEIRESARDRVFEETGVSPESFYGDCPKLRSGSCDCVGCAYAKIDYFQELGYCIAGFYQIWHK